jgi:hypothetical protein
MNKLKEIDSIELLTRMRPWIFVDTSVIQSMLSISNTMRESEYFPNELKPSVVETQNNLELEIAFRN